MKLIIAATDFSTVATNAVNYSCNLALTNNARIVVINSFAFPVMFSDLPLPAAMIDDTQTDAEERMNEQIADLKDLYPNLDISGKVIYGNIIDAIDEYTLNGISPWLVVVGNSNTITDNAWFESTLKDASKAISFPLLAVPPEAIYKPVRKMCLAFDNNPRGNAMALVQLRELAMEVNAELHVLTVQNKENGNVTDTATKDLLAVVSPQFHNTHEADTDDAILKFNIANSIDWLVMIPRIHSFFEGLFHKSHTKAVSQHSNIPVLMLHEQNEK